MLLGALWQEFLTRCGVVPKLVGRGQTGTKRDIVMKVTEYVVREKFV